MYVCIISTKAVDAVGCSVGGDGDGGGTTLFESVDTLMQTFVDFRSCLVTTIR